MRIFKAFLVGAGVGLLVFAIGFLLPRPKAAPKNWYKIYFIVDSSVAGFQADSVRANGTCTEFINGGKVDAIICTAHTVVRADGPPPADVSNITPSTYGTRPQSTIATNQ